MGVRGYLILYNETCGAGKGIERINRVILFIGGEIMRIIYIVLLCLVLSLQVYPMEKDSALLFVSNLYENYKSEENAIDFNFNDYRAENIFAPELFSNVRLDNCMN
jgi:hypothetical protein